MPGPTDLPPDEGGDEYEYEDPAGLYGAGGAPECFRCDRVRPLEKSFRLCRECIAACEADPAERYWLTDVRGCEEPTDAAPGSDAKVDVFRGRLLANQDLFHPADSTREMTGDERAAMEARLTKLLVEPVQRPPGMTGVERDGTKFRARPMHGGKKHKVGKEYDTEEAAVEAVRGFWLATLGLPEGATWDEIAAAREAAAERSRADARARREESERARKVSRASPLYG